MFNDWILQYIQLSSEVVGVNPEIATLDRLSLVYVGLCFLAAASFLFILWCPQELSDHASNREYIEAELSVMTPGRFGDVCARLASLRAKAPQEFWGRLDDLVGAQLSDHVGGASAAVIGQELMMWPDWIAANKKLLIDAASLLYELQDISLLPVRAVISVLYVLGAGFLTFPSLQMFVNVVGHLLQ